MDRKKREMACGLYALVWSLPIDRPATGAFSTDGNFWFIGIIYSYKVRIDARAYLLFGWCLVEVAQVVARCGSPKLKRFFLRIKAKKGYNVAIVALARKILCILHHLLVNKELYQDEGAKKKVEIDLEKQAPSVKMSVEDMIKFVVKAGYEVKKKSMVGG